MNTFRGALRRGHQWRSCDRVGSSRPHAPDRTTFESGLSCSDPTILSIGVPLTWAGSVKLITPNTLLPQRKTLYCGRSLTGWDDPEGPVLAGRYDVVKRKV